MAATEKRQMWLYSGPAPEVVVRQIEASQGIYMAGTPCYVCTAGQVKICATSDGTDAVHGVLLAGVSAELADATEVRVGLITNDQIWAIYLENNGTDLAAGQTLVGDEYGITVSATAGQLGYTTLDTNNSNAVAQIVDIMPNVEPSKYSTSDTQGVALIRFKQSIIDTSMA